MRPWQNFDLSVLGPAGSWGTHHHNNSCHSLKGQDRSDGELEGSMKDQNDKNVLKNAMHRV